VKFGELLDRLDSPIDDWFASEALIQELGLCGWVDLAAHGFTSRPITVWCCTDTWVGSSAVYMDGVLMAVRTQTARKSDVKWQWRDRAAYREVAQRVQEAIGDQDSDSITMIDFDEEIGDPVYQLSYSGEVLFHNHHATALYQGQPVRVVDEAGTGITCKSMRVTSDGKQYQTVALKDLYFPVPLRPVD
jgi:hypothetical protein